MSGAPARPVSAVELIRIEGVSKRYETTSGAVDAVRDVSLAVRRGEFCTIIGPSGCGKSTLLAMVGGLVQADAGRVLIETQPATGPAPKRVATAFQDPRPLPRRTAGQNVEF